MLLIWIEVSVQFWSNCCKILWLSLYIKETLISLKGFHLITSLYICRLFFLTLHVLSNTENKMSFHRLERAKKLQEQKEKELFEKQQQQQQEIAAGQRCWLSYILKWNWHTDWCRYSYFFVSLSSQLPLRLLPSPQTLGSMWQPSWPPGPRWHLRLLLQLRWQHFRQKHWQKLVLLCPATTTHLQSTPWSLQSRRKRGKSCGRERRMG